MKLRLITTPDELRGDRAPLLLQRLGKALREHSPDLAERLEKAAEVERPPVEPRPQALRDSLFQTRKAYAATLDGMLDEIGQALDDRVAELASGDSLAKGGPYVGPKGGLWADPQHTVHWDPKVHGHAPPHLVAAAHAAAAAHEAQQAGRAAPAHQLHLFDPYGVEHHAPPAVPEHHDPYAAPAAAAHAPVDPLAALHARASFRKLQELPPEEDLDELDEREGREPVGPVIPPSGAAAAAAEDEDWERYLDAEPQPAGMMPEAHGVHAYFASGSNMPGEIRGLALVGHDWGVAIDETSKKAMDEMKLYAGGGSRVFIDSGAFGEVKFGPEGPFWPKPITDAEWKKRLDKTVDLARAFRGQAYPVAPDQVANQAGTLERLEKFKDRVREMLDARAHVIMPVQKGAMDMTEFRRRQQAIVGVGPKDVVWGMPMKADSTKTQDVQDFAAALVAEGVTRPRMHLLGMGPFSRRWTEVVEAIRAVAPQAIITGDSVRITALVGRNNGPGGEPRAMTIAQDLAREQGFTNSTDVKAVAVMDVFGAQHRSEVQEARRNGWFDPELESAPGVPLEPGAIEYGPGGPFGDDFTPVDRTVRSVAPADLQKSRGLLNVLNNDPALTPAQKALPTSETVRNILAKPASDPAQWGLPAGARVDPWEPAPAKPDATWEHPDFGSGTGAAPWEKGQDWHPDLHSYDSILINSSAGKDSQAMLTRVVELAKEQGYPLSKVVVVHCDLGRVEWEGTRELAKQQAEHYGLRFEVVQRQQNDLIEQIEERHGDLTQRTADVAKLAAAGITTWADLAAATPEVVASHLGEGKGASKWDAQQRAAKLVAKAAKEVKAAAEYLPLHTAYQQELAEYPAKLAAWEEARKVKGAKPAKPKKPKEPKDKVFASDPVDFGAEIAWPSSAARYCTSDHKRAEVDKFITQLTSSRPEVAAYEAARDAWKALPAKERKTTPKPAEPKPMRILNALGIRAQESDSRAAMPGFSRDEETGVRTVDRWYPIHRWPESRVWKVIADSGVPYHKAYDLGMRRLSCVFCVFADREDLMIAAKHNPGLFQTYLSLEERVGSSFKADHSLKDIADEIARRRAEGLELDDQARWVKKALTGLGWDTRGADELLKAELLQQSPALARAVLEAAFARLDPDATLEAVVVDWKAKGACVHLDDAKDSHHVLWLPYPDAYPVSLVAAAFAQAHGLALEENNAPGPLEGEEGLEKSQLSLFYGPQGGIYSDSAHKHHVNLDKVGHGHEHAIIKPETAAEKKEVAKVEHAPKMFRVVGISDEHDTCDHCGKTGLKRVVHLEHVESGEHTVMGTSCAGKALGWTEKTPSAQQKRAEKELGDAAAAQAYAEVKAEVAANPLPAEVSYTVEPGKPGEVGSAGWTRVVARRGPYVLDKLLINPKLSHTPESRMAELKSSVQWKGFDMDTDSVVQKLAMARARQYESEAAAGKRKLEAVKEPAPWTVRPALGEQPLWHAPKKD